MNNVYINAIKSEKEELPAGYGGVTDRESNKGQKS
jgi:hypothetical protein